MRFLKCPGSYVNIVACIPFELLVIGGYGYINQYRLIKLIRLQLLPQFLLDAQAYVETKLKININQDGVKVFYIFLITSIFITWTSVAWSLLINDDHNSLLDGFYWCFTVMTSTGFGDIGSNNNTNTYTYTNTNTYSNDNYSSR